MSDTLTERPDTAVDADAELGFTLPAIPESAYGADEDATDEDGAEDETDGSETSTGRSGRTPSRTAAKGNNKPLIRRTAAKVLQIAEATETERALAAALVGSTSDVVDLTVAIMSAGRGVQAPLDEIASIAAAYDEDPIDATLVAATLEPARLKAVWSLLHVLEVVGSPTPPPATTKAAGAVVRGIAKMPDDTKVQLVAVTELLKRS